MIQIIKEITVDVAKLNYFQAIVAKQYDRETRFLRVHLTNDGEEIKVDTGSSATINARREDNTSKSFMGTVEDEGTVLLPITYWMLELDGTVRCDVSIISGNKTLTSTLFEISVQQAANGSDVEIDEDNHGVLVSLIRDVQAIEQVEASRVTAENGRVSAEKSRVTAENGRVSAEKSRQDSETSRVNAEKSRVTAEQSRVTAENARVQAEKSRASVEAQRMAVEKERVSTEASRVTAETARKSAETIRTTNEDTRVQHEQSRTANETTRLNSEQARADAESKRASAEAGRNTAEETRQAEHKQAMADCKAAISNVQLVTAPFYIVDADNHKNYVASLQVVDGKPVMIYEEKE